MNIEDQALLHLNAPNIYEILNVPAKAMPRDIRAAVYRLILKEHPHLGATSQRSKALDRCWLVYNIYRILKNDVLRADYDASGKCDLKVCGKSGSKTNIDFATLVASCATLIKTHVAQEQAANFFNQHYPGSALERADIVAAYKLHKGCWDRLMTEVPLAMFTDEPRIKKYIAQLAKENKVPVYTRFFDETLENRLKRQENFLQVLQQQSLEALRADDVSVILEDDFLGSAAEKERARCSIPKLGNIVMQKPQLAWDAQMLNARKNKIQK